MIAKYSQNLSKKQIVQQTVQPRQFYFFEYLEKGLIRNVRNLLRLFPIHKSEKKRHELKIRANITSTSF